MITTNWHEELKALTKAGAHYGHPTSRWNPKMHPYIFRQKKGIHVIDLVQTVRLLSEACQFLTVAASKGKQFLWIGTKKQASKTVMEHAKNAKCHFVNKKWLGGMLTNWPTVRRRIWKLQGLEARERNGYMELLPKKEASMKRKQLARLRKYLGGMRHMTRLPDVVVLIGQKEEIIALQECAKLGIPTVCIVDTDCNPDLAYIPIPANDDSTASIGCISERLAGAIRRGYFLRNGKITQSQAKMKHNKDPLVEMAI
uniref:ribosomal protein S2 n=1 Tax=Klebsormidium subtilissimum TaxID=184584 RepID=UPI00286A485A|nr:ribosomal protein S2 [Klebsormidium subtilissimum]WKT08137.1 ribosomal protein S2 [Klebsormidium subtilissimum]